MLTFYLALIDNEQDQHKFEKLYNQYRKQMFLLAQSVLHNTYDAEDAVHEAFLGIARNMTSVNKINNETDIKNYVLKAAKNASLNIISKKKKYNQTSSLDSIGDIPDDSFLQTLADEFSYNDLVKALRGINKDYFDVLYYHFVMEMTLPEVSKMLNRKLSTVKQQLVRGKKLAVYKLKQLSKR